MTTEYKYYLSTDDSSYGEATESQIEWVRNREREICAERGIEIVECDPMAYPAHNADDAHPDSERIFEAAIYDCPECAANEED